MSTYASGTRVSQSDSVAEIERTLIRYGARGFGYSWQELDHGLAMARVEFIFLDR